MSFTTLHAGVEDFGTVRHLRVAGSQREIGRALAAAAEQVHRQSARPVPASDPALERARRRWFERNHPLLLERMGGVADHFGLEPDDCSVSLDWLGTYDLPVGCSVAFYPGQGTKDGHGRLARNFDVPTATFSQLVGTPPQPLERPLAADPWVIELHPDAGYASVVVTIMDVNGAMDGVNEAGLAVALLADNETPAPEPPGMPAGGLSEQQVVRYLLDTCATVAEAKDALLAAKHYYFFTPCHFVVADRSGASFVWEHSPRRNREVILDGSEDGRLVCTNHLLHRRADPSELPVGEGSMGTAAFTYDRWRTLTRATREAGVVDPDAIRSHFEQVRFVAPVEGARTFWHAQYDVNTASMAISFYLHDHDGRSLYSDLRVFSLG